MLEMKFIDSIIVLLAIEEVLTVFLTDRTRACEVQSCVPLWTVVCSFAEFEVTDEPGLTTAMTIAFMSDDMDVLFLTVFWKWWIAELSVYLVLPSLLKKSFSCA